MPGHNKDRTVPAHNKHSVHVVIITIIGDCIHCLVYLISTMILVDRCYSKLHFPVRKPKLGERSDLELNYRKCLEKCLAHSKCLKRFLLLVS